MQLLKQDPSFFLRTTPSAIIQTPTHTRQPVVLQMPNLQRSVPRTLQSSSLLDTTETKTAADVVEGSLMNVADHSTTDGPHVEEVSFGETARETTKTGTKPADTGADAVDAVQATVRGGEAGALSAQTGQDGESDLEDVAPLRVTDGEDATSGLQTRVSNHLVDKMGLKGLGPGCENCKCKPQQEKASINQVCGSGMGEAHGFGNLRRYDVCCQDGHYCAVNNRCRPWKEPGEVVENHEECRIVCGAGRDQGGWCWDDRCKGKGHPEEAIRVCCFPSNNQHPCENLYQCVNGDCKCANTDKECKVFNTGGGCKEFGECNPGTKKCGR